MCLCWDFYSGTTSKAGKGMAQAAQQCYPSRKFEDSGSNNTMEED